MKRWNERIYALYKGDEWLVDGTIPEIAAETGKSIDYLRWMTYPTYSKRIVGSKKRLILINLEDDEE